jgi:hypothetical protein
MIMERSTPAPQNASPCSQLRKVRLIILLQVAAAGRLTLSYTDIFQSIFGATGAQASSVSPRSTGSGCSCFQGINNHPCRPRAMDGCRNPPRGLYPGGGYGDARSTRRSRPSHHSQRVISLIWIQVAGAIKCTPQQGLLS